jgi:HTH-type transcriptional regulator / antitoxin HigA
MKSRTIIKSIKDPKLLGHFVEARNESEYDAQVAELNRLVDEIGDHPENPRYRLIETLSVLIAAFDAEHHSLPEAMGRDVLSYLMQEHKLSQGQLPEVGSQGVVSEILAGRRELNVRQIRALAERFGVSPAAFIADR